MKIPERKLKLGLAAGFLSTTLVLAGCDDGMDYSELRVIHASKDAPPVNVRVGLKNEITNLDYGDSSGYVSVRSGKRKLAVEAIIPAGNADVIEVKRFDFEADARYNILAINETASIEPLIVAESAAEPAADEVALAVVHASTVADNLVDSVDVYVTDPGVPLSGAEKFNFAYTDVVDAGPLSAGPVQIRVTAPDSMDPVFDSGTVDLSPFAGDRLLIAAISSVNSTEYDPVLETGSPIKLLVANDIAHVVLRDQSINAGARVVHLSPDVGSLVGAVEVFATSPVLADGTPQEIIPTFEYTDRFPGGSDYAGIPAGAYDFAVAPDGAGVGSAVPDSINDIALAAGSEYTVIAAGNVGELGIMPPSSNAFDLLATVDDNRAVVTQASVKVVHAAPLAGKVDVYVTPANAFSATDVESGLAGKPLLDGFAFGEITDYVAVPPNDVEGYDIRVIPEATGMTAISIEDYPLPAGLVATVIARQPDGDGLDRDGNPDSFTVEVLTN